ncbi:DUF6291 domain-containing protein [Leyella stercorea]|uniref:DUF6291 domain-containing protein n=1 Tax=Leyella stercorea TaxID=363265 RepID=UPI001F376D4A|nr:DUF6291 domain-containing protein [Leyella stercorea]MCF2614488.1 hypothetical protein [Leyella stercorea]
MEGFMLYTAQYPAIKTMTQEQKGDLLDALYAYAIDGAQISAEADPMVQMAFAFIRDAIDRAQGKYEAKCERNRQTALKREQKKREAQTCTNVHEHDADNAAEHEREEKAQTCTNVHKRGKTARTCTNVNERAPQSTNVHECSPIKTKLNKTKQNKTNPSIERGGKEKEKESPQAAVSFSALSPTPTPTGESSDGSEEAEAQRRRVEIDAECVALKNYWNGQAEKTGSLVRRVTLLTDARKALIRARLAEYDNDIAVLRLAVDKIIASSYANGENPRNWVATFDWLMTQENLVKTLEGNYDNALRRTKQGCKDKPASAGCDMTEAIAEAQQDSGDKERELKERIEGMVRLVNREPQSSARKALENYERNGTLKRLGIIWEPLLHQA